MKNSKQYVFKASGLVLLALLIVAVGIGNADLVTRVLLPAAGGAR